ncbi:MAG: CfrBI family restriction endonuclease [Candidatus Kapaibacterium sp.]
MISDQIPSIGLQLASYSGKDLIERVGEKIIRDVVTSILCGGNVRALTEGLTQRRLFLSNASLLITYLNSVENVPGFALSKVNTVAEELLQSSLAPEQKVFLQWLIGLTGKSIQNVLRSDQAHLETYLNDLDQAIKNASVQSQQEFGDISATIVLDQRQFVLQWPELLQLFLALGTQTLAVRGSEKSMYGKFFEKLILGSLLTILGFRQIDPQESNTSEKVFWLSQRGSKRESDATVLLKPGTGVRFDVGFIGPGNTEVSLDKVSRFEREMDHGRQLHFMSTIIIVDRIGEGSRITELAKQINGNIVQMSMTFWVREICEILHESIGYKHPILNMEQNATLAFITKKMATIRLADFI